MDLRFACHKLHGFNNSKCKLDDLLKNNDIAFVQEHWLLRSNIYLLTNFNTPCSGFAISGCYDIKKFAQTGGRPYGVVGVL